MPREVSIIKMRKLTELQEALRERAIAKLRIDLAKKSYSLANLRVGKAFRKERKEAGIGLREMARKLNISAAYLSDIELGRRNLPEVRTFKFK